MGQRSNPSLPAFTADGCLPPGDHVLTLAELRFSHLVTGPSDLAEDEDWDHEWRLHLVGQLEVLCGQLWTVGIERIFIDGSFTERIGHPNDIDGYFECDLYELGSGRLERALNKLDRFKVWTWSPDTRRPYRNYTHKRQLPMWHRYRVELYPHFGHGPFSNIKDEHGHNLTFPSAFRRSRRTGEPRGIVRLESGAPA